MDMGEMMKLNLIGLDHHVIGRLNQCRLNDFRGQWQRISPCLKKTLMP